MDRLLIEEKLESLRRCVERIRARCPKDAAALAADPDLQDIVTLNLTRAVQLAVDLAAMRIASSDLPPPDTMGEAFASLATLGVIEERLAQRLKAAVGFRNIAIHSYRSIDWEIVFNISKTCLDDFRDLAAAIDASASPG